MNLFSDVVKKIAKCINFINLFNIFFTFLTNMCEFAKEVQNRHGKIRRDDERQ